MLQQFRDKYLLSNAPGRAFVDWYYRTSPPLAQTIAESELLRVLTRLILSPLVYAIKDPSIALLTLVLLLTGLRIRGISRVTD